MSHQVFKYKSDRDYVTAGGKGEPVSEKFATWQEAEIVRNKLREDDPEHYYDICHFTSVRYIERRENERERGSAQRTVDSDAS